jgi:hypothetical protein
MAYYIIKYEGQHYANADLFRDAVAGGERAFTKMLARGEARGEAVLGIVVYHLDPPALAHCRGKYEVEEQDFDASYQTIHRLPRDFMEKYKKGEEAYMPKARLITVAPDALPMVEGTQRYKHCVFFRIRDLAHGRKYELLSKMAVLRVCGTWYVAFDSVRRGVEDPVIVSA